MLTEKLLMDCHTLDMKRTFGIIACIFLIAGCHTSKRPVLYHLGEPREVNVDALHEKHPSQESAYLFYKRDISHDLKPDVKNNSPRWYFLQSYHWNEVVLDEQSFGDVASVRVEIGPDEKIRYFKARVTHPGKTGTVYKKKSLKRKKLPADSTAYVLSLDGIATGSQIEVAYEIERKNLLKSPPLSHDVALQLDKPVEYLEFAYTYPQEWDVQIKEVSSNRLVELAESHSKKAETYTYTYRQSEVPAFNKEPYGPYFKQVAPYFHVKVNHLEVGNELEWSGKPSWEHVAERYAEVAEASKRTKSNAKDRLRKLGLNPTMDEFERAALIKQHIESDIRVVHNPGKRSIWKSKKGDPLDVAAYMAVLLDEAGISADFLLAHTAEEGYFDDTFVTSEQFYAPVFRAILEGNEVYLFPDKKGIPMGYVPVEYASQVALHYRQEAFEGFTTIDGPSEYAYRDDSYYKLFVHENGTVTVEASLELSPHTQYRINQTLQQGAETEQALVQSLLAHDASHINGLDYTIFPVGQESTNQIKASYELIDCFDIKDEQVAVQSCGLFEPVNASWYPFQESRITTPVMPSDIRVTNHVQVIYPEQWALVNEMQNIAERGEQVLFERTFAQRPGQLDINQHVIFQRQPVRTVINPALAQAFQLPLGTTLSSIKLGTRQQITYIDLPEIQGGPWTLIVETYDSYEDAVDKVLSLEASSSIDAMPVRILSDGPVEDKYHVLVGNFNSRKDVETTRVVLGKDLPYDTWIALVNPAMTAVLNSDTPITY